MATPTGDNNTTPDSSDSEGLAPNSEPMIVDGKVVDRRVVDDAPVGEVVEPELGEDSAEDLEDAPQPPPRNGMANAGMFLGVASLIMNPFGITSVIAIAMSIFGVRRAVAMFKSGGAPVGRIPATIGLALGVATAVFALWVIIANPVAPAA